jgi:hypothetical protein
MIRRDIRLADGTPAWMLIAQRDHAHVSALLASCIDGRFRNRSARPNSSPMAVTAVGVELLPPGVRMSALAAVYHHDDGWDEWEAEPELDADGRPLAFTELASAAATAIWSRSIDAAARFGPLSAWLVAGHFARLAEHSGRAADDSTLAQWRSQMEPRRIEWLAAWQGAAPRHTRELADEALQLLWTFDEVSLWLCCTCLADEPIPCAPEPYRVGHGTPFEMELSVTGPDAATASPWRFADMPTEVTIQGWVVPAVSYQNPQELWEAAAIHTFHWRLAPPQ